MRRHGAWAALLALPLLAACGAAAPSAVEDGTLAIRAVSGAPSAPPAATSAAPPPVGGSPTGPLPAVCRMSADGLPDPVCSPGATNPAVSQANLAETICVSGYTATIRPPTSYTTPLKIQQMARYGFGGPPSDYEEDHVIALELGGDPRDPRNLWPQPVIGAGAAGLKDRLENWAHAEVCAGRMTLADAQQRMASDWRAFYAYMTGATRTPTAR